MKKALINVDYTVDFVAPDGRLTAGQPAQAIEEKITGLTRDFLDAGDWVCLAIDSHRPQDPYHPEARLFPDHNLVGTPGIQLYGALEELYQARQAWPNLYYMPKTRYSAFAGTDLFLKLQERGIRQVHLVGVCTDICVLHTAIDAYNLGLDLVVHREACASFNPAGHDFALAHMENTLGAQVL